MNNQNQLFSPRILNPVKINQVVVFSADEAIRKAAKILVDSAPWMNRVFLHDPMSASDFCSEEAFVMICDDTALNFLDSRRLRKRNKNCTIVLLTANKMIQISPHSVSSGKFPYTKKADMVFAVHAKDCSHKKIINSAIRAAEDHINILHYSEARRFVFLVVDDEPRWVSQFLPVLYDIIGQRADVKVTRTLEETLNFLFGVDTESEIDPENYKLKGHGDDVVCCILDIFFPKGGLLRHESGRDLIRLIDRYYPRYSKIIASKADEAKDFKETAFILPKGDRGSLKTLYRYIHDFSGLGDFIISDSQGEELYRARNLKDMMRILEIAEKDTKKGKKMNSMLEEYGKNDRFSTWLYMHGFKELADKLLPLHSRGQSMINLLKRHFRQEIKRVDDLPLVISGKEIFGITTLLEALRAVGPKEIQSLSELDYFSTWFDMKGFPELANELRPIHGTGTRVVKKLKETLEQWLEDQKKDRRKI